MLATFLLGKHNSMALTHSGFASVLKQIGSGGNYWGCVSSTGVELAMLCPYLSVDERWWSVGLDWLCRVFSDNRS
jgi:hypothetical protein